jgi:hypothetical protein
MREYTTSTTVSANIFEIFEPPTLTQWQYITEACAWAHRFINHRAWQSGDVHRRLSAGGEELEVRDDQDAPRAGR